MNVCINFLFPMFLPHRFHLNELLIRIRVDRMVMPLVRPHSGIIAQLDFALRVVHLPQGRCYQLIVLFLKRLGCSLTHSHEYALRAIQFHMEQHTVGCHFVRMYVCILQAVCYDNAVNWHSAFKLHFVFVKQRADSSPAEQICKTVKKKL